LQGLGTLGNFDFKCCVEFLQLNFVTFSLGDVGVGGDEAAIGQRLTDNLYNSAI
jgi:hypothetical protein